MWHWSKMIIHHGACLVVAALQGGGPQSSSSTMPSTPSHPLYRTDSKTLVKRRDPAALPNRPKTSLLCAYCRKSPTYSCGLACPSAQVTPALNHLVDQRIIAICSIFVVVLSSIWFCTACIFKVKGLTVSNIRYKATNIWYNHCLQWRYRCQKNCWPLGKGEGEVQIHN